MRLDALSRAAVTTVDRGLRSPATLVLLIAGFLGARAAILLHGRVFTSHDSLSYAYRENPAYDYGPLVSLTGHAPRLWGVPLFYALFPSDHARAVAQWTVGTLAWLLLALAVWGCLRGGIGRCLAAGSVLLLSVMPAVASWDFAILSESLSISLGVLVLALLLRWCTTRSKPALIALTAVASWWTFTRPEIRLLIVALLIPLAIDAYKRRGERRATAVAAGVLVIAVGWCTAITPTVSATFPAFSATGLSADEELLAYRLRFQVLPDPQMKALFTERLGLPSCPAAERVAAGREWAIRRFVATYDDCPELAAWTQQNAEDAAFRYPPEDPGLYLQHVRRWLPRSLVGVAYGTPTHVVPAPVEQTFFPSRDNVLGLLAVALTAGLLAAVGAGAWRRRAVLFWSGAAVAAGGVLSAVVGLTLSAGEYSRFGIQEAIGMRLAVVMIAAAALDAVVERTGER